VAEERTLLTSARPLVRLRPPVRKWERRVASRSGKEPRRPTVVNKPNHAWRNFLAYPIRGRLACDVVSVSLHHNTPQNETHLPRKNTVVSRLRCRPSASRKMCEFGHSTYRMQLLVKFLQRGNDASLVDPHEERPLLGKVVRRARKCAHARLRDVCGRRLDALAPHRLHVYVCGRGHVA
jgi:hypothetical protein